MQPAHRIRPAATTDIQALADLAARTFREAFEARNTPDDIASYLERSFAPARIRREFENPASTFLLAFPDSAAEPIGYAKLRSGEADLSVEGPDPVELERLYVVRTALEQGVGAALMKACIDEAARRGRRTLWLGVWEHNPKAIAFYERWGFKRVGAHAFLLGSDQQTDLIMERPVRPDG